ncbi:MAG: hypothetical protein GEV09_06605 [Pseudonocardiaceae bacterium]|nr:hypothetical protein [Pseudonocardiaceae bacterium]
MSDVTTADPRPLVRVRDGAARVAGCRCRACGEPVAFVWPRCPVCRAETAAASFGPHGTVWSATVVRVPVPGRTAPYGLAYVDLDDGPRVLARVKGDADAPLPIGSRVTLLESAEERDVQVEVL